MAKWPIKQPFDIRKYKKNLRTNYRNRRKLLNIEDKRKKDQQIFEHIISMQEFAKAAMILCYVSTAEEIDSIPFLEYCLQKRKKLLLPRCVDNTRLMEFYEVTSLSQLEQRAFGILEPNPESCRLHTDFTNSICIIPALCIDRYGFRLGYGGGYYDRFLSKEYNGIAKIGVCYHNFMRDKLIHGRYDIPCDYIANEYQVCKRII